MSYLIWWLTQTECDIIERDFEVPEPYQGEFQSRIGRAGRGRLWNNAPGVELEGIPWNETKPAAMYANMAGGIVIHAHDKERVGQLPGFITDLELNVVGGNIPPQIDPNANLDEPCVRFEQNNHPGMLVHLKYCLAGYFYLQDYMVEIICRTPGKLIDYAKEREWDIIYSKEVVDYLMADQGFTSINTLDDTPERTLLTVAWVTPLGRVTPGAAVRVGPNWYLLENGIEKPTNRPNYWQQNLR